MASSVSVLCMCVMALQIGGLIPVTLLLAQKVEPCNLLRIRLHGLHEARHDESLKDDHECSFRA